MTNRKMGNKFEREFAEILHRWGFWVHLLCQNQDGQPADMIAVRNKRAYLIDCKVCSSGKGFDLSRVEDNQITAMTAWWECGNGEGWFAVKQNEQIYMVPFFILNGFRERRSVLPADDMIMYGEPLEKWILSCR